MTRVYRCLLRVYPRWFRERYEAELVDAFVAERTRYRGRLGPIRFWMFIAKDLAISACRIRLAMARPAARRCRFTSEEKRHGSSRPGSSPRVSATGPPAGIHGGRGAVARARHRRQRRHLRVLRRLRPPPVRLPRARSRRHVRLDVPAHVERGEVHRGDLDPRVSRHQGGAHDSVRSRRSISATGTSRAAIGRSV